MCSSIRCVLQSSHEFRFGLLHTAMNSQVKRSPGLARKQGQPAKTDGEIKSLAHEQEGKGPVFF